MKWVACAFAQQKVLFCRLGSCFRSKYVHLRGNVFEWELNYQLTEVRICCVKIIENSGNKSEMLLALETTTWITINKNGGRRDGLKKCRRLRKRHRKSNSTQLQEVTTTPTPTHTRWERKRENIILVEEPNFLTSFHFRFAGRTQHKAL